MPDSPLFPWQIVDDIPPSTQEIKDPLSPARITLPRLGGLTVNEVLFAQWASETYSFFDGGLNSDPKTTLELTQFCHQFLCLRLGLADWVENKLHFTGESFSANDSLKLPDGKAIPLYLMYMLYGFFVEENAAWLGKPGSQMMTTIEKAIAPSIWENSTGNSSDTTPAIQDSLDEPLGDAPPTSSKKQLIAPKKQNSAA